MVGACAARRFCGIDQQLFARIGVASGGVLDKASEADRKHRHTLAVDRISKEICHITGIIVGVVTWVAI